MTSDRDVSESYEFTKNNGQWDKKGIVADRLDPGHSQWCGVVLTWRQ